MHKYDPTADLPAASREALRLALDPLDPGAFFTGIFEETAHLVAREDPERFLELVSIETFDAFIAGHALSAGMIDATRADPPVRRDAFTLENGRIDRSALLRLYQDKATLIAPHLHDYHKPLGDFVRALEPVFSASVQTNVYLTPPGARGFRTHYDSHDVFVLQVSGAKTWRLYGEPVGRPFRGEKFEPGRHAVGEPEREFVLRAGDTAYIPRGMMHDAECHTGEASLHITLGLVTRTWADLVLEAISKAALDTDALRRALPPGYAGPAFDRGPARAQFRAFVAELAAKAEFDEPLDVIAEDYLKSRAPDLAGVVAHASREIAPEQAYRAAEDALFRIVADGTDGLFSVMARGGASEFADRKRPAFDRALSGEPFVRADLAGLSAEESIDMIRRLLSRGLIRPL